MWLHIVVFHEHDTLHCGDYVDLFKTPNEGSSTLP